MDIFIYFHNLISLNNESFLLFSIIYYNLSYLNLRIRIEL